MANSSFKLVLISVILIIITTPTSVFSVADHNLLQWIGGTNKHTCNGSVGECLSGEEEFELDSDINRRILATKNYISYGALQRNTVPCSRRGAPYTNCKSGAQANPYDSGCSAIAKCRS